MGYLCRVVTILVPPVCTIEACTLTRALTAVKEEEEEEEEAAEEEEEGDSG